MPQALAQSSSEFALKLKQGWSPDETQAAHHTYEGSQLMPLRWLLNLELENSNLKLIDNVSTYGLIPQTLVTHPSSASSKKWNPYNLPVGFTVGEDIQTTKLYEENLWVGVNCAACHTGMVKINNQNVLIDGGSSVFNIQKFEKDILAGTRQTLSDPNKFLRFAQRLAAKDQDLLKIRLKKFESEFSSWMNRNHRYVDKAGVEVPYGPGRIDGLGGATNDLICHFTDRLGDPALSAKFNESRNCRSSHPPASLPHLWGAMADEFVQWNGAVHHSLGRNYGQATATYGKNWVQKDKKGIPRFYSTADLDGLYNLEKLYDKLNSPSWSDLVALGLAQPPNFNAIARGQNLYSKNCLSCHAVQPSSTFPNYFGNSYWKVKVIPHSIVKTDDIYTKTNAERTAYLPSLLGGDYSYPQRTRPQEKSLVWASEYRGYVIGRILLDDFKINRINVLSKLRLINCRTLNNPQSVVGIKAKNLAGVIFTAPYLHNGSVPTLADLLNPASQRPKSFYVGCRNYDINKFGYACTADTENSELFDTSQEGNSNSGHEYGVHLTPTEKKDLIEFIKSIEMPKRPRMKNPLCH